MSSITTLPVARFCPPLAVRPMARPLPFKAQFATSRLFAIQSYHDAARLTGRDESRGSLIDRNV